MFDIGFLELLLIMVLALLIMGPERLPEAIRTTSLWIAKLRRSFQQMKQDVEQELGTDELRRELHNQAILDELAKSKQQLEAGVEELKADIQTSSDQLLEPKSSNNPSKHD